MPVAIPTIISVVATSAPAGNLVSLVKGSEKSNGALFKHSQNKAVETLEGVTLKRVKVQNTWLHTQPD